MAGTKAPKMRFKIGQRVLYEGVVYEIDGAYRIAAEPHEWKYRLVDQTPIVQRAALYDLEELAQRLAPEIERVVYEPFRDYAEVNRYFFPIPAPPGKRGDTCIASNKQLIQSAKVLP